MNSRRKEESTPGSVGTFTPLSLNIKLHCYGSCGHVAPAGARGGGGSYSRDNSWPWTFPFFISTPCNQRQAQVWVTPGAAEGHTATPQSKRVLQTSFLSLRE